MYLPVRVACVRCEGAIRGFRDSRGVSLMGYELVFVQRSDFYYTLTKTSKRLAVVLATSMCKD